jgi:hypothetical protein
MLRGCSHWWTGRTTIRITLDNLHNQSLGVLRGLGGSDEVHGSLAVLAFCFAYDIHMTAGFILNITDGFTAPADDKANCSIGNKYLCALFCVSKFPMLV